MSNPENEFRPPGSPGAAAPHSVGHRRVAMFAAAATVLVLAVAAAGAVIGHEVWTSSPSTRSALSGGQDNLSPGVDGIAAKVDPAIVDIDSNLGYQDAAGAGTGIVVSSNGQVLTNNHVIAGSTRLTATDVGNGKTYTAVVVGYDPSHDIAVLQLQGASGLQTAKLGDSSKLSIGQPVVGIGNAGGTGGTPTSAAGSITALHTSVTAADGLQQTSEKLTGLIQVNAGIQSGDSGGPLVDANGEVIGIDTAGSGNFAFQSGGGSGYAIPIDQIVETAKQIVAGKGSSTVHIGPTAFLGVQLGSDQGGGYRYGGYGFSGSSGSGVTIGNVVSGKPAEQAGLTAGDTITSLGGQSIDSNAALSSAMLGYHPGDKVDVGWTDSSGQSHSATVELASGPPA